jgi:hypothetical protein
MIFSEKLYYCACISANGFRFPYGLAVGRYLADINIPSLNSIPPTVKQFDLSSLMFEADKLNGLANILV